MKKIFKNVILILIMLFSVNNVSLAKNRYFSDGTEINEKILEGTIGLVIGISRNAHIETERRNVNEAKYILEKVKRDFSPKYIEEACKIVEDENRQILFEVGDFVEGICDQRLINLILFEKEAGIQVNHSPEVTKAIKSFNSLKYL